MPHSCVELVVLDTDTDIGRRPHLVPGLDSPSEDAAETDPIDPPSQLCAGVDGAKVKRLFPGFGLVATTSLPLGVRHSVMTTSSLNAVSISIDEEPCDGLGAGGKASSSQYVAHGTGDPTFLFVTADLVAGRRSRSGRAACSDDSDATTASTAARVRPSRGCVMTCLPTRSSPQSSLTKARWSTATKCVTVSAALGKAEEE